MKKWCGHRLRVKREALVLSQGDLARACGCTSAQIGHIENNVRTPSVELLCAVAQAVREDDLDEFFTDTEE